MWKNSAIALGLAFLLAAALPAQEVSAPRLTLDDFIAAAFERSPELRARRAELEEARARRLTAQTYPFNPEVTVEGAGRSAPGGSSTDRGLEVSQEIEIAGQRARRVEVAEAALAAAEARFQRVQRVLAGDVSLAFAEAVRARELRRIEEADVGLARSLLQFEERRLEAGASTQIDLNLARAAAARGIRRVELARGAYLQARSALAQVAGLDPGAPPEPSGGLETSAPDSLVLGDLIRSAVEGREDLAAFRREEEAARAQVRLEQALARPNLIARAFQEREEGTDDIAGASLSVGIPLFNRNRGGIAEARAAADRTVAETAAARLVIEREVASAFAAYQAASAAAEALRGQVIGNLEENFRLLQRSFEEGKIGRTELFLFRREFVESQREYLDALAEARQGRIRLDLAAGRLPVPLQSTRSNQP